MKKQKKENILTAIIVILVVILIMLIGSIVYEEKINRDKQQIQDTMAPAEEEQKDEEQNQDEEINDGESTDENESKEEYVGEEEQQENENKVTTTKSNDEIAIDLAKSKWGNDDTVTFSIEEKKGTVYYVAVKSDATVIAWYEVNVETEEVSEYY